MSSHESHLPVAKEFRVRVPDGKYPVQLRRLNVSDPEVVLRSADGWKFATEVADMPDCYAISLEGRNGSEGGDVRAYLSLMGGRGSWYYAWDEEHVDVHVIGVQGWTPLEDPEDWKRYFRGKNQTAAL